MLIADIRKRKVYFTSGDVRWEMKLFSKSESEKLTLREFQTIMSLENFLSKTNGVINSNENVDLSKVYVLAPRNL